MRSIQSAMLLAFSGLVLLTVIIMGLVSYNLAEDALIDTARDYTGQLIGQVGQSIDTYIDHMHNISEVVVRNSDVRSIVSGHEEARSAVAALLSSIQQTRDDISLMLLLDRNGTPYFHDETLVLNPGIVPDDQGWYEAAVAAEGEPVVSSARVQNIVRDRYAWVLTLSRTIVTDEPENRDREAHGLFLVDLNFRVIEEMVQRVELGRRGYIFIVDEEGGLVFHPQQQLIYSNLREERIADVMNAEETSFKVAGGDGEPLLYTVSRSTATGWRIVGVNYVDELLFNRSTLQWYYALWGLVCFAAAMLVSILLAVQIARPLRALRQSMKAVERGDFSLRLVNHWHNEIGELADDFNLMLDTIAELMRENAREQEAKRISELKALQHQITPHFLYNTLDSIIWMADAKEFNDVIDMTSALAALLRLSIRQGDELVSVRDEQKHVSSYLKIQSIRYRDSLHYEVDMEPGLQQFKSVKVILQPIVENAIYHGFRERGGSGVVRIRGFRSGDCLVFEVQDDGVGMDEQRMEQLRAFSLQEDSGNGSASVGMRNVHERIRLYFGDAYGLSFESLSGHGTIVRITQPLVPVSEPVEGMVVRNGL